MFIFIFCSQEVTCQQSIKWLTIELKEAKIFFHYNVFSTKYNQALNVLGGSHFQERCWEQTLLYYGLIYCTMGLFFCLLERNGEDSSCCYLQNAKILKIHFKEQGTGCLELGSNALNLQRFQK